MRLLVTGAAGSGTSTLAAALAASEHCLAVEADDLYWLPTDPPYHAKRDPAERDALLRTRLQTLPQVVVAGSVVGWGADALFDRVVFLYVDAATRIARLRQREIRRFGAADPAFLAWAAQYDEGPREGRSLARHEAWLQTLPCPVLRLPGAQPVQDLVVAVRRFLLDQGSGPSFRPLPVARPSPPH